MFIRPVAAAPARADRPPGRPLLRGLLARASGTAEPGRNARWPAAPAAPVARYTETYADTDTDADTAFDAGTDTDTGTDTGMDASAEPTPHEATGSGAGGLVQELAQLAALAREGLLTPEEFSTAKARLLGP
ncbi:SHOCT domain-containing protein [Streptomyces sp. H27-H5]|uniref:SHOCT domain-containing protein n=1 Tax=Streptomyces sp. H27-H5 TaxID=2996460 RepID=UPI0022711EE4|nr:SHOCT domain-containing protein [Streptomyces sp. H27-H5]MCY0956715.1 SHOCT domain-containing protein [Streptomyces sp. H27-H5]